MWNPAYNLNKVIRLVLIDGGMDQNTELENLKVTTVTIETNTQKTNARWLFYERWYNRMEV